MRWRFRLLRRATFTPRGSIQSEEGLHQPCRAQERLVPAMVQAFHAVNLRFQQEARKPAGGVRLALCLLQFLPDSRQPEGYASDGSRNHRSRLGSAGTDLGLRRLQVMQTGLKRCEAWHRHLVLQIDQVIEGWKVRVIDTNHDETVNDTTQATACCR